MLWLFAFATHALVGYVPVCLCFDSWNDLRETSVARQPA